MYFSEPCIQDEDRSGHDMNSCEELKTAQGNFCRWEVKEDIPLYMKITSIKAKLKLILYINVARYIYSRHM